MTGEQKDERVEAPMAEKATSTTNDAAATSVTEAINRIEAPNAAEATSADAELSRLRNEGERLKVERENAQLRLELAGLAEGKPAWWRSGAIVTTLTAIIAAVVPVTTAVQAHYQKEHELALQESKQAHEIRTSYLDRLDKPGAKLRTLRFIVATTTDPALKEWAKEETKQVQAELDEIDRQIAGLALQPQPSPDAGVGSADPGSGSNTLPARPDIGTPSDKERRKQELLRLQQQRIFAKPGPPEPPGSPKKTRGGGAAVDL